MSAGQIKTSGEMSHPIGCAAVVTAAFACIVAFYSFVSLVGFETLVTPDAKFPTYAAVRAILVAIVYSPVHVLIGRAVFAAIQFLGRVHDDMYEPGDSARYGRWTVESAIFCGTFWPLTIFLIPYYLVSIAVCSLYRDL